MFVCDRQGRELAMSINVDSVFAVPTEMPKPAGTISLIARITKQDPRELLAKCEAAKTFCWLARKPDPEISARIRSLNLRGVYFQKESKRYYPKNELAAQGLGYVGMDDSGLSGIEREYDEKLRGEPGRRFGGRRGPLPPGVTPEQMRAALEKMSSASRVTSNRPPDEGRSSMVSMIGAHPLSSSSVVRSHEKRRAWPGSIVCRPLNSTTNVTIPHEIQETVGSVRRRIHTTANSNREEPTIHITKM